MSQILSPINYIKSCDQCLRYKNKNIAPTPLEQFQDITAPLQVIAIDAVGPLERTQRGNKYIITIVDLFTRFFVATPVTHLSGEIVIRTLKRFIANFGLPEAIISDNGSIFKNAKYENFVKSLHISTRYTSRFHPQSNGRLERSHSLLKQSLAAISQQTFSWDESIDWFQLYFNNSTHSATGYTPAFLFFLREVKTPVHPLEQGTQTIKQWDLDKKLNYETYLKNHLRFFKQIQQDVLHNQAQAEETQLQTYKRTQNRDFKIGDKVFLRIEGKQKALTPKFGGPYDIIKMLPHNNAVILDSKNKTLKPIKTHVNKLFLTQMRRNYLQHNRQ